MNRDLAKNTFYFTLASVGQKILAFFYFMLLAHVLMPERTGMYFLALSMTTIFSVVADFGMNSVVIREIAKYPEHAEAMIRQTLGLKIPFIFLASGGAIILSNLLGYDPGIRFLIFLASFIMAADSLSLLYYGALRGFQALKYESIGILFGQLITITFGGLILWLRPELPYVVAVLIAGSVFNVFFSARPVIRRTSLNVLIPTWNKSAIWTLLCAAFPFALAGLFVKIYSYIDSIFLSLFMGTAAVGVYSIAYKFTYAFQFLPMAFVAALYPGMSAMVIEDKDRLAHLFEDAMWYLMLLAVPLTFGIWAVAPDLVRLPGEQYQNAAPVLQTLVFVLIPVFLDFPIGSLLNAANRQNTKTALMGATMIINVVLNAIFIPFFGIHGAAYAALVSFWFLFLVGLKYVPTILPNIRFLPLSLRLAPIVFSGFVMAFIVVFVRTIFGFPIAVASGVAVYILMLFVTRSVRKEHVRELRTLIRFPSRSYAKSLPPHA
ncbi:MAG: Membrane protein involved in the export of O-antigen and teichoic acid [Candidatus Uhrbacteria bacterium GW2011_GWF2_41_16]|uniref:Membrane protein involved in the export of O-antigen and teichoic acid n=2 Tax=Candidatus Uhriibacteriota TaxID=1752732 RepID=A0A0G0YAA7_9BACT|nr:MAG: Membrane protein involved in the export of O-antigen and teichoic acid [Candidatus Uhrbacteria bacterium GW2011_GWA2_41_10]KKR86090.1 MAG: Membrane protein involved in the export of O-antigen and teichoic acid [Candidatus Uhrbacteria bacterium GW2011_GWC2_41_11]KKR97222.1 MAG: Membrane protein involved in the export of O-antigen and teichoic acid [Candidatus Uhrbacteria bacterium GW2011_GWF2_41_16]HBP00433.1 hypothetical protein [Candidatus Uhrbacteria bacterium]